MANALIKAAGSFERLLEIRGYDADHLRKGLAERQVEVVIPTTASRNKPIPYDVVAYRQRNTLERLWAMFKDYRRVANRYLSGVHIAATVCYWEK